MKHQYVPASIDDDVTSSVRCQGDDVGHRAIPGHACSSALVPHQLVLLLPVVGFVMRVIPTRCRRLSLGGGDGCRRRHQRSTVVVVVSGGAFLACVRARGSRHGQGRRRGAARHGSVQDGARSLISSLSSFLAARPGSP